MAADFDDGKDADALRTIGEVSDALEIKQHVLRYWEQQFPILKPLKRSGGRRYYRPGDIEIIRQINRLVNEEGYTLKGAKAAMQASDRRSGKPDRRSSARTPSSGASRDESARDEMTVAEALPKLKSIRSRLATILEN